MTTVPSGRGTGPGRGFPLSGLIVWLAVPAGLALSLVAHFKICTSCSETAAYRLFGLDFAWFGIAYFALLALVLALRRRVELCGRLTAPLLFSAAGAEAHFIWLQKYEIGQWCPICLSLAGVVFAASAALGWEHLRNHTAQGATMKSRLAYLVLLSLFLTLGLGAAITGVRREADAAELDLFLGRSSSPTTVYFVSDWFCPACRKAEPVIEKMYPQLARTVRIGFVDFPIHRETLNFTPYNIQFLAFEKGKYLALRGALSELSHKTKSPGEAEVQAAIAPLGVKLRPMNYSDTLYGMQANLMVYRGYNVTSTPSVVVVNSRTRKSRLLVGDTQISLAAVRGAIAEVEKR